MAQRVGGPVSQALEAELAEKVRRHGLVVWLDSQKHYVGFVERLKAARAAGALKYDVRAFAGSYLELMLALDDVAQGAEKPRLLVYLPGLTRDSVRTTPAYELYAAGTTHLKALDTLVAEAAAGKAAPHHIEAFAARGDLTLDAADGWLDTLLASQSDGLRARLRVMRPTAVLDDLLDGGDLAAAGAGDPALWAQLTAWLGLPSDWHHTVSPEAKRDGVAPEALSPWRTASAAASWALCVEYVDDLDRAPVSPLLASVGGLPRPVVDACRAVAAHLRTRDHDDVYRSTARDTQALLPDEVAAAKAAELGRIDTFRFEEEKVLQAALAALAEGDWKAAADWAARRLDAKPDKASFWLRIDPARQSAWQLVADGARLGLAIEAAGERIGGGEGLAPAIDAYAERGAAVDQAHRHLEQRRVALLYPQIPEFEALRARLDALRRRWRAWADGWATDFNRRCAAHGFLPDPGAQQRTLFDEVVRPLTRKPGTTAFFVVDALRFEMAEELHREIEGTPATTARLTPRLAELPTVTAVGMNALAPVADQGRLRAAQRAAGGAIIGFSTGEFRVTDPETRRRAMHDHVGGGTCPWLKLEAVVSRDTTSLKRAIAQAKLVVVHSEEIDKAGENGVGPAVFDHAMQKLRAAWRLLRDAGVRRFVFTSDHGFLMLDDDAASAQGHGRKIDPKRRHVISTDAADNTGEVRVPLADLGYVGAEGHLMFPLTTAVFDRGKRPASFVHGGNSLQERVIPVLTVEHRAAAGGSTVRYAIAARALDEVGGMHCLEVTLDVIAQGELTFGNPGTVDLALRVPGGEVQVELVQTRGGARLSGGVIAATVGETFELFFRLSGSSDRKVPVELYHPSAEAEVQGGLSETRFAVTGARVRPPSAPAAPVDSSAPEPAPPPEPAADDDWSRAFDDAGVRQVFEHLAAHGVVSETEATAMLGSPRRLRRFARRIEAYTRLAPFGVRVDMVGGVKRYVREGGR